MDCPTDATELWRSGSLPNEILHFRMSKARFESDSGQGWHPMSICLPPPLPKSFSNRHFGASVRNYILFETEVNSDAESTFHRHGNWKLRCVLMSPLFR